MTKRNNVVMLVIVFLSTSHAYAMLCLVKHAQRPCAHARRVSANTVDSRTIEHIYHDVAKVGDRECTHAFTTTQECNNNGCVRFAITTAKNIQMQQSAQGKRDNYMLQLEIQLSSRHGILENMEEHAKKLRSQFFTLCTLEKEAICLMQQAQEADNLESYKKTFTLVAHKMRCISRQVKIMDDNSVFAQVAQDVKEQHVDAKQFASTEVPARWRMLCYNASRWDHPDEMIVYDDSAKE